MSQGRRSQKPVCSPSPPLGSWPTTSPHVFAAACFSGPTRARAAATSNSAAGWLGRSKLTSSAGPRQRRGSSAPPESSLRRRRRSPRLDESAGSGLDQAHDDHDGGRCHASDRPAEAASDIRDSALPHGGIAATCLLAAKMLPELAEWAVKLARGLCQVPSSP